MKQYCVYFHDESFDWHILSDFTAYDLDPDMHVNRARFWLDHSLADHVQFYLKWSHCIHDISHETNHATGT